jgi:hypothetical protein
MQGHQPSDPVIHQFGTNNHTSGGGGIAPNNAGNGTTATTTGTNANGAGSAAANPNITGNDGTATILARLKELESTNQLLAKHLEEVKLETQRKEDKIKLLSADKRKDMEQMIETAIDTWLNSLTGISEEVRKQFRSGVSRIAEQADLKNAAWEVVCQASQLHRTNVDRIEELLQTCNSQNETIKSLVGSGSASGVHDPSFTTEASRLLNNNQHHNKRQRVDGGGGGGAAAAALPSTGATAAGDGAAAGGQGPKDAWDMFDSMLREDSRAQYYSY